MIRKITALVFSFFVLHGGVVWGSDEGSLKTLTALYTLWDATQIDAPLFTTTFNATGRKILADNCNKSATEIMQALKAQDDGKYNYALEGNNYKLWGVGQPQSYIAARESILNYKAPTDTTLSAEQSTKTAAANKTTNDTVLPQGREGNPKKTAIGSALGSGHAAPQSIHIPPAVDHSPHVTALPGQIETGNGQHPSANQNNVLPSDRPFHKKAAFAGGALASAAAVAWLISLIADKESRNGLNMYFKKIVSKKVRDNLATKSRRIKNTVKKSGEEFWASAGALAGGIAAMVYGYKKSNPVASVQS